ncbi:MAG: hypothetical protein NTX76_06340 [Alphaproteobacteria bacterium]|nr:hypothetical protein [Alphaproteobacteria bacterium]
METELILSAGGLPPLSARGCTQELMPISNGSLKRTVNGELVMVGSPVHKYRSVISCDDKTVMATEGLYPGIEITVGCIQRLWQKVMPDPANSVVLLDRAPIEGSVAVVDVDQQMIPVVSIDQQQVRLLDRQKIYYVSYRPWLAMRMVTYRLMTNEWGIKSGWRLELEEI